MISNRVSTTLVEFSDSLLGPKVSTFAPSVPPTREVGGKTVTISPACGRFNAPKCVLAGLLSIATMASPVYAQTLQSGGELTSIHMMGGNPVSSAPVPVLPVQPNEVINQTFDVPIIVIHAKYAYPTPKVPAKPSFVPVQLPQWPAMYGNLAEYDLPIGNSSFFVLAPRGMKSTAEVGQDGSYNVTLRGHGMEVDLTSTGACGMCAVDAAGTYFPGARSYARSIEGAWRGISIEKLPVTQLLWNTKTDLFAYRENGNRILAGFSYYTPTTKQSNSTFISEVITGDSSHVNALAPWLSRATLRQIPGSGVNSVPSGLVPYQGSSKMVQQIRKAHLHLNALNAEYWPILGTRDETFDSATVQGNVLVLKYRDVTMMDSPAPFPNQRGVPIVLQNGTVATWIPHKAGTGGEIYTKFNGVYMRLVSTRLSAHQLMDVAATSSPLDG